MLTAIYGLVELARRRRKEEKDEEKEEKEGAHCQQWSSAEYINALEMLDI